MADSSLGEDGEKRKYPHSHADPGGVNPIPISSTESTPDEAKSSTEWSLVALLDLPNSTDSDGITNCLKEAGCVSVSGVKVSHNSNPVCGEKTHATALVKSQQDLNGKEVEIWPGFDNVPCLELFKEECVASFSINSLLLPDLAIQNISKQASRLQLMFCMTSSGFQVCGSCVQVQNFREYIAALCVCRVLRSPELKTAISIGDTGHTMAPEAPPPVTIGSNSYANLSPDVLLLLPKLKEISGLKYFPEEGRVEVMATDPEEKERVISKFQEAYQHVVSNRQLKTGTIELPASCKAEEIGPILEEYNAKYLQCHFSYIPTHNLVKVVSLSSRQFEQAKKLLYDRVSPSAPSTVTPHPIVSKGYAAIVLSNGCTLAVKKGNIVNEEADVLVNAANSDLKHWGGVAQALDKASNGKLQKHCDTYTNKYGPVAPGDAVITSAGGSLKCKHVVHAVGPDAFKVKNENTCQELIFSAVTKTLIQANKIGALSVILPALSTGIYSVPAKVSANAMFSAIFTFKAKSVKDVRIVILDENTFSCFSEQLLLWHQNTSGSNEKSTLERSFSDQGLHHIPNTYTKNDSNFKSSHSTEHDAITEQPSGIPTVNYPVFSSSDSSYASRTSFGVVDSTSGLASSSPLSVEKASLSNPPAGHSSLPSISNTESPFFKPSALKKNAALLLPSHVTSSAEDGRKGANSTSSSRTTSNDNCPICLNSIVTNPFTTKCCKKVFCKACLDTALQHSSLCPTCAIPIAPVRGNQPNGTMNTQFSNWHLPGYPKCGTITIVYKFPDGVQGTEHPNPGKMYSGTERRAYLPDNEDGREVLQLLKKAFDARVVFTIGTSVTSGKKNTIVWNDVHHKTNSTASGNYGYPDTGYFKRVKEDLKAKGIF